MSEEKKKEEQKPRKPRRPKLPRTPMPEQDAHERAKNFDSVTLGYTVDQALVEASRCLMCKKPFCIKGCPVAVNIPAFIKAITDKDMPGAVTAIKDTNLLPAVCGRVCPQEDQCEKVCVLGKKQEPVAIGRLERFVADWEAQQGEAPVPKAAAKSGKKVAVVGAGPAGLTVAGDCIKAGHEVTVFEALHKGGGVLVYGIPEFRLPKAIVQREVDYLEKLGVEFKMNYVVGKIRTIPQLMEEDGYDRSFGAAVNITAATTGLIIPPSNILIVYSLASGGVSITALFLAGYLPGILVGLSLMLVAGVIAARRKFPVGRRVGWREMTKHFLGAVPGLLMLVVVMGGIISGVFTATEAAAVAVLYALILALAYREITIRDLPQILLSTSATTAIVMLLVGTSIGMSWILAYENIPQNVSLALIGLTENKILILLIINLVLLAVGVFMDITPAVLIFTPIFLPIAVQLGVDPVHFGIIMVLNLCVGLCTPPVGTVLFVGVGVAGTSITRVIRPLLPLYVAMIVALMIVTYVPALSLWLPSLFGME